MTLYLHLVCDYAPGDLAWAEVWSAFSSTLPDDVKMHITSVRSFDTIATGFILAQLGMSPPNFRPENVLVFGNCAPRKDLRQARQDNEGEGLLYGILKSGVKILAVNSGFSLSFIRSEFEELWSTTAEDRGSQFRSRDYFPNLVGSLVRGDQSCLLHRLEPASTIPEAPKETIAYIDSFGNLKTTIRTGDPILSSLKSGTRIKVTIGSVIRTATVASGSFNVLEGDLAFAPGSSGYDKRYWELFKRGGSAWQEFAEPANGTKIQIIN